MKKICIDRFDLAVAVMSGCGSIQESIRNTKTIHGALDSGVKLGKKRVLQGWLLHKQQNLYFGFSSDIVSDDTVELNEKQKNSLIIL